MKMSQTDTENDKNQKVRIFKDYMHFFQTSAGLYGLEH